MRSIFKRYCLTYTYLSKYVKTSNEDKYKRGATNCSGKWIPQWLYPLVPDAMPYGVRQSGWTEQCSCRSTGRTNIPACNALGQKIPVRWNCGTEKQTGEWPKAHYQHQKDKEAVREAIRKHRQSVSKARAAWEEATGKQIKDGAFRNFLSLMAQDLDV